MSVTYESLKTVIIPEFAGEIIGMREELEMRPLTIDEVKQLLQLSAEIISYIKDDKFNKLLQSMIQREIKIGDEDYKTPKILEHKILWFTNDGRFILILRK